MWRSLVAHLTGGQGVAGSNPVIPTGKAPVDLRICRGFVVGGNGVGLQNHSGYPQSRLADRIAHMAVSKDEIVAAIRREAVANGGVPLGQAAFVRATGIGTHNWKGGHWARWSDAVAAAGFEASSWGNRSPIGDLTPAEALEALAQLVRDFGRFPTDAELRLRKRSEPATPHPTVFRRRLGSTEEQIDALYNWAFEHDDWADVAEILVPLIRSRAGDGATSVGGKVVLGSVYLFKSGAYYKVGRSNSVGRRAYEVALQLPERLDVVHAIETDDPEGIEAYWHRRFAPRRANGEWFKLTADDLAAFKRRRYQ